MLPSDLGLPPRFTSFLRGKGRYSIDQERYITSIVSSEKRFRIPAAPPGSGKSLIYIASTLLAGGRGLVLVKTKALQQQLEEEFGDLVYSIVGHTNYPCVKYGQGQGRGQKYGQGHGQDDLDDDGDSACPLPREECHYHQDCAIARTKRIVVTNYAHDIALARIGETDRLGEFDFLVLDEAHNILDQMTDLLAVEVVPRRIARLFGLASLKTPDKDAATPIREWIDWAEHIATLRPTEDNAKSAKVHRLRTNLRRFTASAKRGKSWVVEHKAAEVTLLKPVWCDDTIEPYLFRGIQNIILTSATINRKSLGFLGLLDEADYDYWEVPSTFDPARRPFYIWPTIQLDRRTTEGQFRVLVNRMDSIIESRDTVKGLIQSVSYDRARDIERLSRCRQRLLTHRPGGLGQALQTFRNAGGPLVLCSPVIDEGVSFPYDECRFAILPKVPYRFSQDPIIKARTQADKSYVDYTIADSIEQMYGRGMRAPDDACECFMLDSHFGHFAKKVVWHRWFREGWRYTNELPPPLNL